MKVNKHIPTPPPTTYDLIGLTEEQVRFLKDAVGGITSKWCKERLHSEWIPMPIYRALDHALEG